jgi:hypothetical protein
VMKSLQVGVEGCLQAAWGLPDVGENDCAAQDVGEVTGRFERALGGGIGLVGALQVAGGPGSKPDQCGGGGPTGAVPGVESLQCQAGVGEGAVGVVLGLRQAGAVDLDPAG